MASVQAKEESARFGLPAFKMLDALYTIAQALAEWNGASGAPGIDELWAMLAADGAVTLVAATDGNHGRTVARTAYILRLPARIFNPRDVSPAAQEIIKAEGAELVTLNRGYDDTVPTAAADADTTSSLLIQDTSWQDT